MLTPYFVVDAFVIGPFSGNPAAVCLPPEWPEDRVMQLIAAENNLSETAFCMQRHDGDYDLRWFTPRVEIDLCGHATLASAHVLMSELAGTDDDSGVPDGVAFHTRSGRLTVERDADGYAMSLPAADQSTATPAPELLEALGIGEAEVLRAGDSSHIVVLAGEADLRSLNPDFEALAAASGELVCVTAPAREFDFVVRVFAPNLGIDEDPATGSAQCMLAPFWATRLGKEKLCSFQASARGAVLRARWAAGDGRVIVGGRCATFVRGELELPARAG